MTKTRLEDESYNANYARNYTVQTRFPELSQIKQVSWLTELAGERGTPGLDVRFFEVVTEVSPELAIFLRDLDGMQTIPAPVIRAELQPLVPTDTWRGGKLLATALGATTWTIHTALYQYIMM